VHADVVLIDDHAGRQEAIRRGLKVAGTLSVLDEADQAGLVIFDGRGGCICARLPGPSKVSDPDNACLQKPSHQVWCR
jgi:hypothetical protein